MLITSIKHNINAEALNAAKNFRPNLFLTEPSVRVLRHSYGGRLVERLLNVRQPSEPEHIFNYRINNFRNVTKAYFDKVFSILSKIRHAKEFVINYPSELDDPLSKIDDSLETYCSKNFPETDDIENWLFSDGLYALLTEPNGVIGVIPETLAVEGEFLRPKPVIYEAKRLAWTNGKEYLLYTGDFKWGKVSDYYSNPGLSNFANNRQASQYDWHWVPDPKDGVMQFIYYGENEIYSVYSDMRIQLLIEHNFGETPAFIIGGIKEEINGKRFRSIIDGAVDWWDEVVVMESDLQGAIKQHVYPEKAVFVQDVCKECFGTKTITLKDGSQDICHSCGGTGMDIHSVYATHYVRPQNSHEIGQSSIPFPPVAYVNKDLGSVNELRIQIERAVKAAYSALNMEFLTMTPLEQSGIAKAYDRQEMNSFIAKVAEHLIKKILNPVFWYILLYRYKWNPEGSNEGMTVSVLNSLMPLVNIPTFFDIIPPDYIATELQMQRASGMSQNIIAATESEYQVKRFVGNQEARRRYELVRLADPLPAYSLSEKETIRMSGGCTLEDYVLSVNLERYITQAEFEDSQFWDESVTYYDRIKRLREMVKKEMNTIRKDQPEVLIPSTETETPASM